MVLTDSKLRKIKVPYTKPQRMKADRYSEVKLSEAREQVAALKRNPSGEYMWRMDRMYAITIIYGIVGIGCIRWLRLNG